MRRQRTHCAAALCVAALCASASAFDCSFASSYPRQYVAYKSTAPLVVDGRLDEPQWTEVGFTERFVDIATTVVPQFDTRAKIRWDDKFLFVGAVLEEPTAWANITSTCHCIDPNEDQVRLGVAVWTRGGISVAPRPSPPPHCVEMPLSKDTGCGVLKRCSMLQEAALCPLSLLDAAGGSVCPSTAGHWQACASIYSQCRRHQHAPSPPTQVIFHDNDFEVFVDAPGTTHYYKEFEVNALNATWDLMLNRTYDDGGSENSSRVFGPAGWDYALPVGRPTTLHSATHVWGGQVNDPATGTTSWSVEIAMPLAKLVERTRATAPPAVGDVWRINFSRVEWAVRVVNGRYEKFPSCQSCSPAGSPNEDNWVWSPMGAVAMHAPDRWGILQFADGNVNATPAVRYGEWPVRAAASAVYEAQAAYAGANGGAFAPSTAALLPYLASPDIVNGVCNGRVPVRIALGPTGKTYEAVIPPNPAGDAQAAATINQERYLLVAPAPPGGGNKPFPLPK